MTHIYLPQPIVPHDDLMRGHRVEQLVGDEHAFERRGQRWFGGCQSIGHFAERGALSAARGGARFDELQAKAAVEVRMFAFGGAKDIRREPSVSRAGLDEIE